MVANLLSLGHYFYDCYKSIIVFHFNEIIRCMHNWSGYEPATGVHGPLTYSLPQDNGPMEYYTVRKRRRYTIYIIKRYFFEDFQKQFTRSYLKIRIFVRDQEITTPEEPRPPVEASSKPSIRTAEIRAKRLF
jgi:hypothetical protein